MRAGIRARLLLTRLLGAAIAVAVLASASHWSVNGPAAVAEALFAIGALLAVGGFGGRLWALRHIAGRKNRQLVRSGPYAMCRHPLYLFSLVGGLGLVMCTGRLSLVLLYLAASWLIMPAIRAEEAFLEDWFAGYASYRAEVPALLPQRWGAWRLRDTSPADGGDDSDERSVEVGRRGLRRALLETAAFLSPLLLFGLLERAQAAGTLPVLFVLP